MVERSENLFPFSYLIYPAIASVCYVCGFSVNGYHCRRCSHASKRRSLDSLLINSIVGGLNRSSCLFLSTFRQVALREISRYSLNRRLRSHRTAVCAAHAVANCRNQPVVFKMLEVEAVLVFTSSANHRFPVANQHGRAEAFRVFVFFCFCRHSVTVLFVEWSPSVSFVRP